MTNTPKEDPKAKARTSFTGRALTDRQFEEAWQITAILHRDVQHSGSFIEKLTDYAHAYARNDRFDAARGEMILRDLFTDRYGQSLNQMREALLERETALRDAGTDQALHHARSVPDKIRDGATLPFYQAYDQAAIAMARQHGITEAGAKSLMKDAYAEAEGADLYTIGKALEAEHHTPVRDAEIAARRAERKVERKVERGARARTGPVM